MSRIGPAIRFGFSVGRVRALEGRLLPNTTLERLLDAKDFGEQKRVLADTEYASVMGPSETAGDVERALDTYLGGLFEFIETSRLPEAVSRFFRVGYDYLNMKGRLKAEALGAPLDDLLSSHGTVPLETFRGPTEALPRYLCELDTAVRDSRGEVEREAIDPVVDRAMFKDMRASAAASECEALEEIAALTIDLANVKTVVRARALDRPVSDVWKALVEGGRVRRQGLLVPYGLPFAEMIERIAVMVSLPGMIPRDLAEIQRLDVLADNLLMRHARQARLVATGIEPVVGYVMARRSELVIVRTLLLGRLAGMGSDAMRGRMRELYV